METLYYNTGDIILTINYPSTSGHYCIETEDDVEIGTIKKVDDKWITDTEQLISVVTELGEVIDTNDDI